MLDHFHKLLYSSVSDHVHILLYGGFFVIKDFQSNGMDVAPLKVLCAYLCISVSLLKFACGPSFLISASRTCTVCEAPNGRLDRRTSQRVCSVVLITPLLGFWVELFETSARLLTPALGSDEHS